MFTSLFRASSSAGDRSPWGDFWFKPVARGGVATADSAMTMSAVYASVRVLAESFAVMLFVLYRPRVGGGRQRVTDHWLYRLFCKAPNRFQSPFEWREMLMGHLALRGNAYCEIHGAPDGSITELIPLHPDRMRIEVLPSGEYRYRYTRADGTQIIYKRGDIWHIRGLSSDGIIGLSPIQLMAQSLGEGLEMEAFSSRFFANDGTPGGGWIEFPGKFADLAAKKAFRDQWKALQGGSKSGSVAVLDQGMKYHELAINNKEAQFLESRAAKVTEVARIFRLPPHKIGDLTRSTNNNIEHQGIEFWTDVMLPWAERWESSIEHQLLGEDTDLDPEFDMRRMMRGDSAARSAYYASRVQWGSMTRNEVRIAEGDEPLPGLDEPLVPLNMVEASNAPDELAEKGAKDDQLQPADGETDDGADARLQRVLQSNAARMARRIAAGSLPSAEVLADALAIKPQAATLWLSSPATAGNESDITASLLALGATA